jgi:hypothetical protein
MIPWSAFIYVEWWTRSRRQRCFSLWIPLFVAWLVLLPLVLVLFPVVALACVFIRINAFRLYAAAWGVLTGLRKTRVEVRARAARVLVNIG